jgi:hypothetical protein
VNVCHGSSRIDLPLGDGPHVVGQIGLRHPLAQHLRFVGLAFAQLLLNRLELLPQVVLTLGVSHFLLRLRFNLALELEHRHLAREQRVHQLELLDQRVGLEELLPLLGLDVEHRRQQIREAQRILDAGHELAHFRGQAGRERERAVDELLDPPHVRVHFDAALHLLGREADVRAHHVALDPQALDARPRHAFDDDVQSLRAARHLAHHADRADVVHLLDVRFVFVAALEQQQDHAVPGQRRIHRLDRHRPVDGERLDRHGEGDRAPQRDDGELSREYWRCGLGHECLPRSYVDARP